MNTAQEIEYIPACALDRLIPYEKNPRINNQAVAAVALSLERFGAVTPMVVDENFRICTGHTRFKAATQLGLKSFPVKRCRFPDEATFIAYNLADNKTGEIAEWDNPLLAEHAIKYLTDVGFDMAATGFDGNEIDELLELLNPPEQTFTDPDDIPSDVPVRTKRGDIWLLGDHRVMCGDATDKGDMDKLLGGDKPELCVTDPPYGVDYDPAWRNRAAEAGFMVNSGRRVGKVASDDRCDWSVVWGLIPSKVLYCWHGGLYANVVQDGIKAAGFIVRSQIIWSKPHSPISRGHYRWQHEPCWYGVRKGSNANWKGDHSQTTVWHVYLDKNVDGGHSTQKPVELMMRPLRNHKGDVYDPFLGTGTMIIAAEQLNRKCYGMEIEPKYVDVTVKRWENFTGKEAIRG